MGRGGRDDRAGRPATRRCRPIAARPRAVGRRRRQGARAPQPRIPTGARGRRRSRTAGLDGRSRRASARRRSRSRPLPHPERRGAGACHHARVARRRARRRRSARELQMAGVGDVQRAADRRRHPPLAGRRGRSRPDQVARSRRRGGAAQEHRRSSVSACRGRALRALDRAPASRRRSRGAMGVRLRRRQPLPDRSHPTRRRRPHRRDPGSGRYRRVVATDQAVPGRTPRVLRCRAWAERPHRGLFRHRLPGARTGISGA